MGNCLNIQLRLLLHKQFCNDDNVDQQNNKPKKYYKVIFVGDTTVGKTSIISRIVRNEFDPEQKLTIGVEFNSILNYIKPSGGNEFLVSLQLWDTNGQPKYRSFLNRYNANAKFAVVVFSLDDRISFDNVNKWINEIYLPALSNNTETTKIILVGNKADKGLSVSGFSNEIADLTKTLQCKYFEVSALTGKNCDNIIKWILQQIALTESTKLHCDHIFV